MNLLIVYILIIVSSLIKYTNNDSVFISTTKQETLHLRGNITPQNENNFINDISENKWSD